MSLIESLNEQPVSVGTGIPGVIDDGQALTVPNVENWVHQVDVRAELQRALGVPVALGNDVDIGLLGEWWLGSHAPSTRRDH